MEARARVRACIQQPIGCPRPLQRGRLWLCALEQQEHLLQQRTNGRVGYARFGSNLPRVPSEQGTDAGAERVVVLTWAGKDAPPGRAALRLDDHMARRSLVCLDSGEMYNLGTTIVRVVQFLVEDYLYFLLLWLCAPSQANTLSQKPSRAAAHTVWCEQRGRNAHERSLR